MIHGAVEYRYHCPSIWTRISGTRLPPGTQLDDCRMTWNTRRRHMLDLAKSYERTADAMAPPPSAHARLGEDLAVQRLGRHSQQIGTHSQAEISANR